MGTSQFISKAISKHFAIHFLSQQNKPIRVHGRPKVSGVRSSFWGDRNMSSLFELTLYVYTKWPFLGLSSHTISVDSLKQKRKYFCKNIKFKDKSSSTKVILSFLIECILFWVLFPLCFFVSWTRILGYVPNFLTLYAANCQTGETRWTLPNAATATTPVDCYYKKFKK